MLTTTEWSVRGPRLDLGSSNNSPSDLLVSLPLYPSSLSNAISRAVSQVTNRTHRRSACSRDWRRLNPCWLLPLKVALTPTGEIRDRTTPANNRAFRTLFIVALRRSKSGANHHLKQLADESYECSHLLRPPRESGAYHSQSVACGPISRGYKSLIGSPEIFRNIPEIWQSTLSRHQPTDSA